MVCILHFHLYVLVRYRFIISSVVIFRGYYKFDFHLAIVHCLIYFLSNTYTGDYMLTYYGITVYIMLSFLYYDI